mmetsp:Transcript_18114/g.21285  ORF Transcript_18114/g.21285 Transcript_18114/m.21285 type:complete len:97 (+) Transcript_18114:224-514(+)
MQYYYSYDVASSPNDDEFWDKLVMRQALGTFFINLVAVIRVYLGCRWICRRNRNRFALYYRASMTFCFAMLSFFPPELIQIVTGKVKWMFIFSFME